MKTYSPKPQDIERRWYVIDADGVVLGRLASEVAKILRGKHKPIFAPHADTGDHVIVVNARGVRLTGGKEEKKVAYRHSGFPGGIRGVSYGRLMTERPATVVQRAVRGMLPHNRLGRQMAKKLAVYEGSKHPHEAQRPEPLAVGEVPRWTGLPQPKPKTVPTPTEAEKKGARKPAGRAKTTTSKSKATAKTTTAKSKAKSTTSRSKAKTATATKAPTATKGKGSAGASDAGGAEAKKTRRGGRSKSAKES
jgi:large subunit ribosomal protein L13